MATRDEQIQALRDEIASKFDPNGLIKAFTIVNKLDALLAEDTAEPGPTTWLCGCGSWSGVNLPACAMCNRLRSESDITYQFAPAPHREAESQVATHDARTEPASKDAPESDALGVIDRPAGIFVPGRESQRAPT